MALIKLNTQSLGTTQINGANLPSGTVLQVKNDLNTTQTTLTTSNTDVTGVLTITLRDTSSKVWVNFNGNFYANTVSTGVRTRLYYSTDGGSTYSQVHEAHTYASHDNTGTDRRGTMSFSYLHSPASTNELKYKIQQAKSGSGTGSGTVQIGRDNDHHDFTIMEIAG